MSVNRKKTIIGLTGNIATGKTVVRRMLGHLGAYTIDADALTHRIMAPDGPGFKPIVAEFGKFILDESGSIDRKKLGKVVFGDPGALASLEAAKPMDGETMQAIEAMSKDTALAFICHTGNRSQVAGEHFRKQGFTNVSNVVGGIEAWSKEIASSVPQYGGFK